MTHLYVLHDSLIRVMCLWCVMRRLSLRVESMYSQSVAVCCSVLQCIAMCGSALPCVAVCCSVLQCVAVCCSVLQSVLQCIELSRFICHVHP